MHVFLKTTNNLHSLEAPVKRAQCVVPLVSLRCSGFFLQEKWIFPSHPIEVSDKRTLIDEIRISLSCSRAQKAQRVHLKSVQDNGVGKRRNESTSECMI